MTDEMRRRLIDATAEYLANNTDGMPYPKKAGERHNVGAWRPFAEKLVDEFLRELRVPTRTMVKTGAKECGVADNLDDETEIMNGWVAIVNSLFRN